MFEGVFRELSVTDMHRMGVEVVKVSLDLTGKILILIKEDLLHSNDAPYCPLPSCKKLETFNDWFPKKCQKTRTFDT